MGTAARSGWASELSADRSGTSLHQLVSCVKMRGNIFGLVWIALNNPLRMVPTTKEEKTAAGYRKDVRGFLR